MATNIKVAIATGDAVLKYVDTDTTVGSNGGGSSPTPTVTRILAIMLWQLLLVFTRLKDSDRLQTRQPKDRPYSFR